MSADSIPTRPLNSGKGPDLTTARVGGPGLSRRSFLRSAALAMVGIAAIACTTPPKPTPKTGETTRLVYQDARVEWFPPMAQQMLEEFHASHPNIRVFYLPEPDSPKDKEEKMLADMQAGTAPDVFQGCCSWFPIWAQKGFTLDLRPYVAADLDRATLEDWDQAQYNSFFTRDGRQYGLPKYHGALALYYNKDIFDQHHVEYPDSTWTHDDYLTAMKRVTSLSGRTRQENHWGSMIFVSWDRIQMHVNGWGGHFVDPNDPTKCRMADPEALNALEWLRARMWDDKVMATDLDVEKAIPSEAFASGRLAMVEAGSWALKDILTKSAFRLGVVPFPAGPARKVTLATTDGFGIYAGTRHTEAAWELVKFLIGKNYGRAMARANFLQPARASLVDEWVGFIRQEFPEKARDADIAAFADGHLKGYSVTAEVFANMGDATRIATDAWDRILTLGQAPVGEMKVAARQIQEAQSGESSGGKPCCQENP